MERRQLGTSDLSVSRLGFGAWATGGGGWAFSLGPTDDSESIAAIRRSAEFGINWIDTAPLYGLGHSEEVVARALDGLQDRPYIFTKCGMPWDDRGRITHCLRRESIRRECEASLRRLRLDSIDLYQIHWNKPADQLEEGVAAVAELQREGKIRHIGLSNFTVAEIQAAQKIAPIVTLQPPYSIIERSIEADVLPFCSAERIGVLVYSPMKSGLLSGRMTRERILSLSDDDLRRSDPEFNEPRLTKNLMLVEQLKAIAVRHRNSVAEVAIGWALNNEGVDGVIVGIRRAEQLESVIGSATLKLTAQDLEELEEFLRAHGEN